MEPIPTAAKIALSPGRHVPPGGPENVLLNSIKDDPCYAFICTLGFNGLFTLNVIPYAMRKLPVNFVSIETIPTNTRIKSVPLILCRTPRDLIRRRLPRICNGLFEPSNLVL